MPSAKGVTGSREVQHPPAPSPAAPTPQEVAIQYGGAAREHRRFRKLARKDPLKAVLYKEGLL